MNIEKLIEDGIVTCEDCYYCHSNNDDKSINCEDETWVCDDFMFTMIRADLVNNLEISDAVWFADCLNHVYPVSIKKIDWGTVFFTNDTIEALSTYGETWGLWMRYPEDREIAKQFSSTGVESDED